MSTLSLVNLLFAALAFVMTGLGLSLRTSDFIRLTKQKREVLAAIALQMAVLPVIAFAIIQLFGLSGLMAAGLMLLAATPGSISANLYSHIFGGNVALTLALTGLNTFLCALTLPAMTGWALAYYSGNAQFVPMVFDKALETIAVVVIPVLAGMFIAAKWPRLASALANPVKIVSALVVIAFSLIAIIREWAALSAAFAQIGAAVSMFNAVSLLAGVIVGRLLAVGRPERISLAFQVSVHNAILAIYVAMGALNEPQLALPAALYSITMNLFALGFGAVLLRSRPVRVGGADTQVA